MPANTMNVETVLEHYIIAALWSTNDESDESGGEPFDKNYSADDIAPEAIQRMRDDVTKFVGDNWQALQTWDAGETTAEQQTGHDFWLNRNGHGVGFWESEWREVGERLDEAAKAFGECDLYLGDDGLIYCA